MYTDRTSRQSDKSWGERHIRSVSRGPDDTQNVRPPRGEFVGGDGRNGLAREPEGPEYDVSRSTANPFLPHPPRSGRHRNWDGDGPQDRSRHREGAYPPSDTPRDYSQVPPDHKHDRRHDDYGSGSEPRRAPSPESMSDDKCYQEAPQKTHSTSHKSSGSVAGSHSPVYGYRLSDDDSPGGGPSTRRGRSGSVTGSPVYGRRASDDFPPPIRRSVTPCGPLPIDGSPSPPPARRPPRAPTPGVPMPPRAVPTGKSDRRSSCQRSSSRYGGRGDDEYYDKGDKGDKYRRDDRGAQHEYGHRAGSAQRYEADDQGHYKERRASQDFVEGGRRPGPRDSIHTAGPEYYGEQAAHDDPTPMMQTGYRRGTVEITPYPSSPEMQTGYRRGTVEIPAYQYPPTPMMQTGFPPAPMPYSMPYNMPYSMPYNMPYSTPYSTPPPMPMPMPPHSFQAATTPIPPSTTPYSSGTSGAYNTAGGTPRTTDSSYTYTRQSAHEMDFGAYSMPKSNSKSGTGGGGSGSGSGSTKPGTTKSKKKSGTKKPTAAHVQGDEKRHGQEETTGNHAGPGRYPGDMEMVYEEEDDGTCVDGPRDGNRYLLT